MRLYWALLLLLAAAMVTVKADDVDVEDVEEDAIEEEEVEEEQLEVFQPPTPSGPTYFHDAILSEREFWNRYCITCKVHNNEQVIAWGGGGVGGIFKLHCIKLL